MRIDSSGNVGIGITNPATYDSNADNLVIGSVGVNDKNGITIVGGDTDGRGAIYFADTTQNSAGYITYKHVNDSMLFGTSDSTALTIDSSGNVGIGNTSPIAKLDVNGATRIGGKTTYSKGYASLDTTGNAVAGLGTSGNGTSARLVFEMHGGAGEYQRVVYSCYNASGNWYPTKVIDEGTNVFDVTDSGNGTTVTFTFKARTASQAYSPYVTIEHVGAALDTSYL
jgi:hypothetical protein